MRNIEEELKDFILDKYNSIRQFALAVDMPYSTIDSIFKRGVSNSSVRSIIQICKFLNLDSDELADGYLVEKQGKANNYAPLPQIDRTHLTEYKKLSDPGKEKATAYVIDIQPQHPRTDNIVPLHPAEAEEAEEELIEISIYTQKASAGFGNYLSDQLEDADKIETIRVKPSTLPFGTDKGVKIDGDSMTPLINDGDVVWIEEMASVEHGDIGLFVYEGDSLCKQLFINTEKKQIELHSLNAKYKPIIIYEDGGLRTIGKVLIKKDK